MTNWYNYYYNEVIRDAEKYLDDHFEEFVIRDIDDHEITDYADTETIEDALFLSDEVCGNGDMGHPRIPEDLGDVIFPTCSGCACGTLASLIMNDSPLRMVEFI